MNLVIIGTGNTATVLGRLFRQHGHHIVQVYGRNQAAAAGLAQEWGSSSVSEWKDLLPAADFYLIAVSDSSLPDVIAQMPAVHGVVVHTAGSVSRDLLANRFRNYGVLYPLQSLNRMAPAIPAIPFLVDAPTPELLTLITDLALSVSSQVEVADDEQRRKWHVAAVVVNNFSNYLFALTKDFCEAEGMEFSFLHPLMRETVMRLEQSEPAAVQTGPARRGDQETIDKQVALLSNYPDLQSHYLALTEGIKRYFYLP